MEAGYVPVVTYSDRLKNLVVCPILPLWWGRMGHSNPYIIHPSIIGLQGVSEVTQNLKLISVQRFCVTSEIIIVWEITQIEKLKPA